MQSLRRRSEPVEIPIWAPRADPFLRFAETVNACPPVCTLLIAVEKNRLPKGKALGASFSRCLAPWAQ